ncbi:TATA box-binding protein-associated factor RNA polymerase I subunit B-like, partial [Sinocyclocheilus grahami]|uniref:TATA box-binding protein-associated factor RNA polymerase I subunit B-like n=1 Tax=Sinocyclocheilus grahami TaxID=75366 RepID=UPI0007AC533A
KTREVVDVNTLHSKHSRISQITRPKKKRPENEREWMICEGFQFILKHQAKALVSLGVCMKFETEVLWNFWTRYLQNTQQAFTRNPVYTPRFTVMMVSERCVPYMNIHESFPEELSLFGKDVQFFNVRYLPSYSLVHKEAVTLARILQLPSFPTVSKDCFLHPFPLTVRYLLEANLPNDLHVWVHKVIRQAAMGDSSFLTFEPSKEKPHLLRYDIQAVAVIIVTLKLLFKLNDHVEWYITS